MKTTAFALLGALALLSQSAPTTKPISINLREGTNMAAALSPDGRTLMIDLQGSLWTLPASGGPAKRVTDEYLDARQPAWAPDNRRVAFQGYADGVWHIYVMNADGIGPARDHVGPLRRSRAVVVARRQPHRVLVGSIGQLRRLRSRRRQRHGSAADEQSRERLRAGVFAGQCHDRLRQRARGSPRRLGGRYRDGDRAFDCAGGRRRVARRRGALTAPG